MIMKVFTTHLDQNLMIKMINIKKNKIIIQTQNDDVKLLFIGSNNKRSNFNTFRKALNFISAIYNEEISLKETEISQTKIEKKTEDLQFNYKPKNKEEKEEINGVLMQVNDVLEYRNKVIHAF